MHLFIFSHYISLPQLAFDCMLKLTGVHIELMEDPDMVMFVEQNIRGGLSYISQRYSKVGKEKRKDGKQEFVDLLYVDGEESGEYR